MESTNNNFRNIKETYKILETLGQGSFASVRKIRHKQTGEYFAVKILKKS